MHSKFSKSSAKLNQMKHTLQRMLGARQFEQAERIAAQIRAIEEAEAGEAADKMQKAYEAAIARVDKKFANERETVLAGFQMKLHQLERARDQAMLPRTRMVEKCAQRKISFAENQRRNPRPVSSIYGAPERRWEWADLTVTTAGQKLRLPELIPSRRGTSHSRARN
jgi:hypothetical protein